MESYGPMGINSSIKEPKGTQGGPPSNFAANSNKYNLSPNLNRFESDKDDSSSEAHLQSSKTSRGSYLDPELYMFYLVTQSL